MSCGDGDREILVPSGVSFSFCGLEWDFRFETLFKSVIQ